MSDETELKSRNTDKKRIERMEKEIAELKAYTIAIVKALRVSDSILPQI